MLERGILGSGRTHCVSFQPFPNSSSWWWLISSVFLIRISCHKTTHGNGYYGAWPGWAVSISVLPLTEWVTISFSNAWKWKMKVKLLSGVRLFKIPWTAAYQAPLSMGFSRQRAILYKLYNQLVIKQSRNYYYICFFIVSWDPEKLWFIQDYPVTTLFRWH